MKMSVFSLKLVIERRWETPGQTITHSTRAPCMAEAHQANHPKGCGEDYGFLTVIQFKTHSHKP